MKLYYYIDDPDSDEEWVELVPVPWCETHDGAIINPLDIGTPDLLCWEREMAQNDAVPCKLQDPPKVFRIGGDDA